MFHRNVFSEECDFGLIFFQRYVVLEKCRFVGISLRKNIFSNEHRLERIFFQRSSLERMSFLKNVTSEDYSLIVPFRRNVFAEECLCGGMSL